MDIICKICLVALMGCLLGDVLKRWKGEYGLLLMTAVILGILSMGQGYFVQTFYEVRKMCILLGEYESFWTLLLRILGISWLCQFTGEMSREAGYGSVGTQVELIGKIYIVFSGFPIVLEVLRMVELFS